jgi:GNAT superfamily N-acetyltransferase
VAANLRRATVTDLAEVCALLDHYYTEWDIWQRDEEAKVLADLREPQLGFLLAEVDARPAGCVLVRSLPGLAFAAECKRLFVAPEFRGQRLADRLMDAAEEQARTAGYAWMYLDSKPEFAAALVLYHRRGYVECPRYNDNAQAKIFLRKSLAAS